jgi:hypothetical protein
VADWAWQKNLRDAVLLDPLVLVHGNVKDLFAVSLEARSKLPKRLAEPPYLSFDMWLATELEELGFPVVILYDPIDGAVALRGAMANAFEKLASQRPTAAPNGEPAPVQRAAAEAQPAAAGPVLPKSSTAAPTTAGDWMVRLKTRQTPEEFFRTLYDNVLPQTETPVAVVCRFMDRYLNYSDRQDSDERRLSLLIQKAAMAIPPPMAGTSLNSRIVLIFDMEGETPQELNVQAPFARSVLIPPPGVEEREAFFRENASRFDSSQPGDRFNADADPDHLRLVAILSDGLKSQDLFSLISLSRREQLGLGRTQVKELLDRFKYGTRENAWLKVKPEMLRGAKETLSIRVKGQNDVIDEVIPVLIRAKLGMTDISTSLHSAKPRGVFFFVGPTGVGKTELSKAIAELIFGDENAMIRFDMSEYSEEHQQARLIGAPPGYVGFDQGGQLTNAITEKPFSVVLFDEIEKAHGRILDKFLQILDDGRLTDGMGRTVYFSEAILIFTSNLGSVPHPARSNADASAAVTGVDNGTENSDPVELSDLSYPALCEHFRGEVKYFFVHRLGRPEILNRIGEDNILVFNFIRDEETKIKIVDLQIELLQKMLRQKHDVGIIATRGFKTLLMTHPSGFVRNGARGVRNLLSKLVLNPLAEQLFLDPDHCHGKTFRADYKVSLAEIPNRPFDKSALDYEWISE